MKILLIGFLLLINLPNFAQKYYDFSFRRDNSIIVKDSFNNNLSMPWVGGLNAVHFQQIDLNMDNVLDLVSFDTHGDVLKTFINNNIPNTISYTYAPEYETYFPKCYNWIDTYDYDNDGKMDLFTHTPGGIAVYKNISTNSTLKFKIITNLLKTYTDNTHYSNIPVSSVEYPAFVDLDFDGDMDILNVSMITPQMVMYKNYSMEKYGIPDSLDFKIKDNCWGKFAESPYNDSVYMNRDCLNTFIQPKSDEKHSGSTVLAIDLNGDSLMDLIVGDLDYFHINALINHGTKDSAKITDVKYKFPTTDSAVNIASFNLAKYLDVNNDGKKELIVAPFDPSYYKTATKNNVWLYENVGTNSNPDFKFKQNNFLQEDMIDIGDGATPTLVDVNGNGLMDIILGKTGNIDSAKIDNQLNLITYKTSSLSYFKNIGTINNPSFKHISDDWMNLSKINKLALKPTFGDLDGDGDMDLILGNSDGSLIYMENIALPGQPMQFGSPQYNYSGINVGGFSTPQLIDINGDSLLDLVIGTKLGSITYYQNTGTAQAPIFTLITSTMGNVENSDSWNYNFYSVPYFFYDNNDSLKAVVGAASGLIFYYKDIRANILGDFVVDSNLSYKDDWGKNYYVFNFKNERNYYQTISCNFRSAPIMYDFNHDGFLDLMIGTFGGGLNYYKGVQPDTVNAVKNISQNKCDISIYPNPSTNNFNINIKTFDDIKYTDVKIYDLSGKELFIKTYAHSNNIKVENANLNKGIYFVNVCVCDYANNKINKVLKFIKL